MSSSILTKRRNPFGEEREYRSTKVSKPDLPAIYNNTLKLLMTNPERSTKSSRTTTDAFAETMTEAGDDERTCFVCMRQQSREPTNCNFCSRETCGGCTMQCEKCMGLFCKICSVENHDMRFDRIFCLTCDAEERELHRQRQRGSSTPFGSPPQSSPPSGYGFGPDYNYRGNQNIGVWFSEDSNSSADGNGMNIDS